MTVWMAIMAQLVFGASLIGEPHLWALVGGWLLIFTGLGEVGAWFRWCARLATRDRTYAQCDACGGRRQADDDDDDDRCHCPACERGYAKLARLREEVTS